MNWNWKHKNWPNFIYDPEKFAAYEKQFLHKAGTLHGSMRYIGESDQEHLKIEIISMIV